MKESFQIYYDLAEIMNIFIDRFMELEVSECLRVHGIFSRLSRQFEDLEGFYGWCRTAGICRSSEYPEVERITDKKLNVMDDFIRDKSRLADSKKHRDFEPEPEDNKPPEETDDDKMCNIKALPAPEDCSETPAAERKEEVKEERSEPSSNVKQLEEEVDLLNLKDDAMTGEEHGNRLALALFDGSAASSKWEAFADGDSSDWETALVQSASKLADRKAELGGGLDMLLLDGMYAQAHASAVAAARAQGYGGSGSASSVAIQAPAPVQPMLALPAPPTSGATGTFGGGDPFTASLMVPVPPYVQMSDMEKKQRLLVEEKQMWERYARDGMQGQLGLAKLQNPAGGYQMGGYNHRF